MRGAELLSSYKTINMEAVASSVTSDLEKMLKEFDLTEEQKLYEKEPAATTESEEETAALSPELKRMSSSLSSSSQELSAIAGGDVEDSGWISPMSQSNGDSNRSSANKTPAGGNWIRSESCSTSSEFGLSPTSLGSLLGDLSPPSVIPTVTPSPCVSPCPQVGRSNGNKGNAVSNPEHFSLATVGNNYVQQQQQEHQDLYVQQQMRNFQHMAMNNHRNSNAAPMPREFNNPMGNNGPRRQQPEQQQQQYKVNVDAQNLIPDIGNNSTFANNMAMLAALQQSEQKPVERQMPQQQHVDQQYGRPRSPYNNPYRQQQQQQPDQRSYYNQQQQQQQSRRPQSNGSGWQQKSQQHHGASAISQLTTNASPHELAQMGSSSNPMNIRNKFGSLGNGDGQFNAPHGFCLGASEQIIVADTNNHRIQLFAKDGSFLGEFGTAGKEEGRLWFPRKVAVIRPSGHFVICDRGNERSRMQVFDRYGQFVRRITIRYIDIVAGLAINRFGQIVAVDSVTPTVFVIDPKTGELVRYFECSGMMTEPSDIAVFQNEYYICDFKGHCVVVIDDETGRCRRKIGNGSVTCFPNGIDISDQGDVLVGDSHGNQFHVAVFERDGTLASEFMCPHVKVSRCCGLKISSEGYVVTLAKNNHHVLVLDTLYVV